MILDGVSYSAFTVLKGHIITYGNALSVVSLFGASTEYFCL